MTDTPEPTQSLRADAPQPGADPAGRPQIVEEILHLAAPRTSAWPATPGRTSRSARSTSPTGDAVIISTLASNRDDAAFPDAEVFDPDRPAAASHLRFGHGAHYRIGASLARTELRVALTSRFTRLPTCGSRSTSANCACTPSGSPEDCTSCRSPGDPARTIWLARRADDRHS